MNSIGNIYINKSIRKTFENLENLEENNQAVNDIDITLSKLKVYKSNLAVQRRIVKLSSIMPAFRIVRRDGNSLYRSFGFVYLEFLLTLRNKIRFNEFLNEINDNKQDIKIICSYESLKDNNIDLVLLNNLIINFLQILKLLYFDAVGTNISNLKLSKKIQMCLNKIPAFDLALILIIRNLVRRTIEYYSDNPKVDPVLFSRIKASQYECKDYIIDNLHIYGIEAQNLIIELLSKALKVKIIVNHFDEIQNNEEDSGILQDIYQPDVNLYELPEIHLCYSSSDSYEVGYVYDYVNLYNNDIMNQHINFMIPYELKKKNIKNPSPNNTNIFSYMRGRFFEDKNKSKKRSFFEEYSTFNIYGNQISKKKEKEIDEIEVEEEKEEEKNNIEEYKNKLDGKVIQIEKEEDNIELDDILMPSLNRETFNQSIFKKIKNYFSRIKMKILKKMKTGNKDIKCKNDDKKDTPKILEQFKNGLENFLMKLSVFTVQIEEEKENEEKFDTIVMNKHT